MTEKQSLHMVLRPAQLPNFYPLLQQGVWLQAQIGCSVMDLLTEQFGVDECYVVERITTLFLDGKAIDAPESSYVKDGATLALSSAMPGLVGATMRRGGHLAAMRGAITYRAQPQVASARGRVRVKLFNMVMAELGATILAQGIYLSYAELASMLDAQGDSFWQGCRAVSLGSKLLDQASLVEHVHMAASSTEILLSVEFMP